MVMRRTILIFLLLLSASFMQAQSSDGTVHIRAFLGADSEEELDPYEVEKMQDYLSRPLRLNSASPSSLLSSGLLTQYQVASFMHYVSESGAVMSLAELAAVDGFGQEFVRRLAPFISLATTSLPGQPSSQKRKMQTDAAFKAGYKTVSEEGGRLMYGSRLRTETDRGSGVSVAVTRPYDAEGLAPKYVCGNMTLVTRRSGSRFVIGDFNARFGQGLAFWNGTVMSGLSGPASFSRRGSGISGSGSFTGSSALTGVAAGFHAGRFVISALTALPGIKAYDRNAISVLPAVNVAWYGRNCQFSVTDYAEFSELSSGDPRIPHMKTSADLRFCVKGTDVFSEAAYDWVNASAALICGTSFPASENMRMSAMMRLYPSGYDDYMCAAPRTGSRCSNEAGVSVAADINSGAYVAVNGAEGFGSSVRRHQGMFSFDAVMHPESRSDDVGHSCQVKVLMSWQSMLSDSFRLAAKLSGRYRNWEESRLRSEMRLDLTYLSSCFTSSVRADLVKYSGYGFLAYAEAGYTSKSLKAYLRQGVFFIDDWNDRIYAYERDAPGNFSVPAYYGRGLWTAFYCSWRFARWGRLYARASVLSYPFMEKKKPGKAELKLQMEFSF